MSLPSDCTVTVSVNVATGNMNEGNSTFSLNISSVLLGYLNLSYLEDQLSLLVQKALIDYRLNNDLNENYNPIKRSS